MNYKDEKDEAEKYLINNIMNAKIYKLYKRKYKKIYKYIKNNRIILL